ncbi:prepilin peptidase [Streptomyces sp. 796.1]|uniref:prepilin peptidase n=1 Tax=Streptomyces sp. 796.1 TaxID=3163029 RepID=UPI0039C9DE43
MHALLIALAAGYGAAAGLLVGRPLFRLAVPPADPWRTACPGGHPIAGPAAGWLGRARCTACRRGAAGDDGAGGAAGAEEASAAEGESAAEGDSRSSGASGPDVAQGGVRARGGEYGASGPLLIGSCALTCAALAAAVGLRPELAVWLLLVPLGVLLAGVDLAVHRLPDVLTLPMAVGSAALLGGAALLPGAGGSWSRAVFGGLALGGAYFVLFLINPSGMGFGDVKLALTLGVALGWYGWDVLFLGAFTGLLLGAFYGVALVLTRRASRKAALAFGPFMIVGAGAGVLLGGLAAG